MLDIVACRCAKKHAWIYIFREVLRLSDDTVLVHGVLDLKVSDNSSTGLGYTLTTGVSQLRCSARPKAARFLEDTLWIGQTYLEEDRR